MTRVFFSYQRKDAGWYGNTEEDEGRIFKHTHSRYRANAKAAQATVCVIVGVTSQRVLPR
jgi:hypothetical protein